MRKLSTLLAVLSFATALVAQQTASQASITYELSFPGGTPEHYLISVDSVGRASYRTEDAGEPYVAEFTMSAPGRERIFKLAAQADYFKGNFNYAKGHIANTGKKTLTYIDPAKALRQSAVYNWSENQAIQQLTEIFSGISNTMELGRRLSHLRRFDKLSLDDELKRAEEMAKDGRMVELGAIAPALQDVVNDYSVMHVARQRAEHLLKIGQMK